MAALTRAAPFLASLGCRWGPGGSVGFELATTAATTRASSDLDVILRQPLRLATDEGRVLLVFTPDKPIAEWTAWGLS